jgi:hypothetical protein
VDERTPPPTDAPTHPLYLALAVGVATLDEHPDYDTLEVALEQGTDTYTTSIIIHRTTPDASPQP